MLVSIIFFAVNINAQHYGISKSKDNSNNFFEYYLEIENVNTKLDIQILNKYFIDKSIILFKSYLVPVKFCQLQTNKEYRLQDIEKIISNKKFKIKVFKSFQFTPAFILNKKLNPNAKHEE